MSKMSDSPLAPFVIFDHGKSWNSFASQALQSCPRSSFITRDVFSIDGRGVQACELRTVDVVGGTIEMAKTGVGALAMKLAGIQHLFAFAKIFVAGDISIPVVATYATRADNTVLALFAVHGRPILGLIDPASLVKLKFKILAYDEKPVAPWYPVHEAINYLSPEYV